LPKITYKLVNINSCAVHTCMYLLLAHSAIIYRLTYAAQFPFCPSPIPPPDHSITFTWNSKQSTYLNFHFSLCFQIQFQDTGRHVYYWEVNGLYVFQISWLWGSSSLQQNHCFSRYTALPTAAKRWSRLLLKDTHSYC